jgi:hypothetical protein
MFKPINECKTVYELLEDPERWIKKRRSLDKNNFFVPVESTEACKFCLAGAVYKIYDRKLRIVIKDRLNAAIEKYNKEFLSKGSVIGFNDDPKTTHQDVLEVVKMAGV